MLNGLFDVGPVSVPQSAGGRRGVVRLCDPVIPRPAVAMEPGVSDIGKRAARQGIGSHPADAYRPGAPSLILSISLIILTHNPLRSLLEPEDWKCDDPILTKYLLLNEYES